MISKRGAELNWFLIDLLAGGAAVYFSFHLRGLAITGPGPAEWHPGAFAVALVYGLLLATVSYGAGLNGQNGRRPSPIMLCVLGSLSVFLATIIMMGIFFLSLMQLGRLLVLYLAVSSLVLITLVRFVAFKLEAREKRKAIVIRDEALPISAQMRDLVEEWFQLDTIEPSVLESQDWDVLVKEWVDEGVDDVIVGGSSLRDRDKLFVLSWQNGIRLLDWNYFVEVNFRKLNVYDDNLSWLMELEQHYAHPAYSRVKRFIDIVGSSLAIILFSPIMLLGVLLVLLDSRGPVIFRQQRIGIKGEPFMLWKLRTMTNGRSTGDPRYSQENDKRITRVGKFLRKTRIDELPQFFNILCGDMSLVGPRPEWDEIAEKLSEEISFYPYRSMVKPGLTGWAQINFGYAETKDEVLEKLSYDFYYIKHASIVLDFRILLRTCSSMFHGAR